MGKVFFGFFGRNLYEIMHKNMLSWTRGMTASGTTIPMCPVQVEGPLGPETVQLGHM